MSVVVPSQFAASAAPSTLEPLRRSKSCTVAAPKLSRLEREHSAAALYEPAVLARPTPQSYAEVAKVLDEPGYLKKHFNTGHYRALVTLEAAMDFLAVKLAYRMDSGDVVRLNVRRTQDGDPCDRLDRLYDVAETLQGTQGCVAHRLLPRDGGKDVIVLFRGTQRQKRPSGLRANTERCGAGHSAYAEVAPRIETWVREAQAAGQHVNIVGHSLGGAIGLRLLAALPPEAQARCSMFGAHMPKSWPEVVGRIANGGSNMFACINPRDVIAYGGKVLPSRARIVCAPINGWRGHCVPSVASQEFDRQKILLIPYKPSILRFLPVEMARVATGILRGRRFPF